MGNDLWRATFSYFVSHRQFFYGRQILLSDGFRMGDEFWWPTDDLVWAMDVYGLHTILVEDGFSIGDNLVNEIGGLVILHLGKAAPP